MVVRVALLTIEIVQRIECKSRANLQVVVSILMANNSSKVPAEIPASLNSLVLCQNLQDPSGSIGTTPLEYNFPTVQFS
jgi:hypothetical protein